MCKIETSAANAPQTDALRRVLANQLSTSAVADYLFLEAWERDPSDRPGVALRIGQIRRANPALAAAIRTEIGHDRAQTLARIGLRPATR
jgi:hypothetical protein